MVHFQESNVEVIVRDGWFERAICSLRHVLRLFACSHLGLGLVRLRWLVGKVLFWVDDWRPCLLSHHGRVALDNSLCLQLNGIRLFSCGLKGFNDFIFHFLTSLFRLFLYVLGCCALCCGFGGFLYTNLGFLSLLTLNNLFAESNSVSPDFLNLLAILLNIENWGSGFCRLTFLRSCDCWPSAWLLGEALPCNRLLHDSLLSSDWLLDYGGPVRCGLLITIADALSLIVRRLVMVGLFIVVLIIKPLILIWFNVGLVLFSLKLIIVVWRLVSAVGWILVLVVLVLVILIASVVVICPGWIFVWCCVIGLFLKRSVVIVIIVAVVVVVVVIVVVLGLTVIVNVLVICVLVIIVILIIVVVCLSDCFLGGRWRH